MPTPIGFLRHNFLPRSETFIYGSLRALEDAGEFSVRVFATRQLLPERYPCSDLTQLRGFARSWYLATRRAPAFTRWARSVRLIHAHLGQTGPYAMAGAAKAGIPFVVSYYGHDVALYRARERFESWAWWHTLLRRRMFARAAKIIVLSRHMQQALEDQGCPAEKIEIVRLGVDLARFDAPIAPGLRPPTGAPAGFPPIAPGLRPPTGAPAGFPPIARDRASRPLRVLMVGREVDKKGFDDGVRACRAAIDRGVACELTVLGTGGPLAEPLRKLADELGVQVAWPDPASSVAEAMAHADVLLAPSRTAANGDQEGTPTVIIEAGAARLAVVSTRHAGIPEQVEQGVTGILADERDIEGLAEALVALARDPERRAAMGEAARGKMRREYSLTAHAERLQEVYASVLRGPA